MAILIFPTKLYSSGSWEKSWDGWESLTPKDTLELIAPAEITPHFTQIGLKTEFISLINETFPSNARISTVTSVTTDEGDLIWTSCDAKGGTHIKLGCVGTLRWWGGRHVRIVCVGEKSVGSPTPSYTSHCIVFDAGGVGWWWSSPSDAIKDAIRIVLNMEEWDKRVEIRLDSATDGWGTFSTRLDAWSHVWHEEEGVVRVIHKVGRAGCAPRILTQWVGDGGGSLRSCSTQGGCAGWWAVWRNASLTRSDHVWRELMGSVRVFDP